MEKFATVDRDELRARVEQLLAEHDPATTDRLTFLQARFDAGLAWVHYPPGLGGLGAPRELQSVVDDALAAVDAPDNDPRRIGIGLGMAAPTILVHGTDEQRRRWLRPLWTGEEVWCQLFSEPGAGSDLAALGTRAVREDDAWIVNGQKVWTSMAHEARWAILVTRTDPSVPKHAGMTYFACDMTAPGVEVRPLRQITGEAEFNEVFLTDVRIPDEHRLGDVGNGWRVAQTTLMNERVAIGGGAAPRESGTIAAVCRAWRERPELRTPAGHAELMRLWVEAEALRLTGLRLRQQLSPAGYASTGGGTPTAGAPGPEGSAAKLSYARLNQAVSGFELDLLGDDALGYDDWSTGTWASERPAAVDFLARSPGYRYLRAKGNSIEGGTSEILRNIIAERVLGLPGEPRVDKDVPWKDLPK